MSRGGIGSDAQPAGPTRGYARKLDGAQEAQVIALACGAPPTDYAEWCLRLLADQLVELDIVESISHQTVGRVLKKRTQTVSQAAVADFAQTACRVGRLLGVAARSGVSQELRVCPWWWPQPPGSEPPRAGSGLPQAGGRCLGGRTQRQRHAIDWRFTTEDARIKLRRLYPSFEMWMWTDAVVGDRGYSSSDIRNWLTVREIEAVIPKRKDELGADDYDAEVDRERNLVERAINRLKRYRAVATRYDKLVSSYLATVTIACILEWLSLCKHTLVLQL